MGQIGIEAIESVVSKVDTSYASYNLAMTAESDINAITIKSTDLRNAWGRESEDVRFGRSTITITRHKRPLAVVISYAAWVKGRRNPPKGVKAVKPAELNDMAIEIPATDIRQDFASAVDKTQAGNHLLITRHRRTDGNQTPEQFPDPELVMTSYQWAVERNIVPEFEQQ